MSANHGTCRQCGHEHRQKADMLACDAIHGRVMVWPASDVRDPFVMCTLCNAADRMSELLYHFREMHRREPVSTGHLVRGVMDTRAL